MSLENKVVIITGAGSGIGAASAKLFASKKAKVIVSDINELNANMISSEIKAAGGEAEAILCNVTQFNQVESLIKQAIAKYGQIDVFVNNAGIGNKHFYKTAEHTVEDWDQVIAVNQTGVFYGMKLALQVMQKQGHGNIINVASLAGVKASGKNLAYSASKFAVVGMTKSAALEYASKNIRINAVCPGYTDSALLDRIKNEQPVMAEKLFRMIPMRRTGEANEIAQAITWLASEQSTFITGQTITLDGGLSL
jgi:NAD(P)-dependent dehydrogenase (short-subunit alcohol dehydrogenase family)